MPDKRSARRVSGEIMTGQEAGPERRRCMAAPGLDIVDADFEILESPAAGRRSRPAPRDFVSAGDGPPREGMAMLRRNAAPAACGQTSRGGPIFWTAGLFLVLVAFWISGGHALVRGLPLFAQQDAAAVLSISGVTSRVDGTGLRPVLLVDGEAGNDGAAAVPLPPLDIKVTGNDGRITRYRLGTSGRPLEPGERFVFSSRVEVPRNGVTAVTVGFAE